MYESVQIDRKVFILWLAYPHLLARNATLAIGTLFELIIAMWNNYLISMIRNYKSWSGLAIVNILGIVAAFGLIITLIRGFLVNPDLISFFVIILVTFVVAVAYANFTALQLRKRRRETYVRKLLGARDVQIMQHLLIESVVLVTFLVVSGLVLAELFAPVCGAFLGIAMPSNSLSFGIQVMVVMALVFPVGVLGAIFPIRGFVNYVNSNMGNRANRT